MDTTIETCGAIAGCSRPSGHKGWHTGPNGTAARKRQGNGGGPAVAEPLDAAKELVRDGLRAEDLVDALTSVAPGTATVVDAESFNQMARRVEAALAGLDRYGWHLGDCPAYDASIADGPASKADDTSVECTCGFRRVLLMEAAAE